MTKPLRVMVADDHTLVREGLRLLLETQSDLQVVAEAADGPTALSVALAQEIDLLVLDFNLPELDGVSVIEGVRCQKPEVRVIVLSMHAEKDWLLRALRAGADGYVLKGAAAGELIEALRAVGRGGVFLPPALLALLIEDLRGGWRPLPCADDGPEARLSGREREVLQRLAEGETNAEIAAALVISISTVQTHRGRIFEKLQLKTRADLVKYALRHGLIQLE
jgi:DNA-binding NarL/FixJ family response regulator